MSHSRIIGAHCTRNVVGEGGRSGEGGGARLIETRRQ